MRGQQGSGALQACNKYKSKTDVPPPAVTMRFRPQLHPLESPLGGHDADLQELINKYRRPENHTPELELRRSPRTPRKGFNDQGGGLHVLIEELSKGLHEPGSPKGGPGRRNRRPPGKSAHGKGVGEEVESDEEKPLENGAALLLELAGGGVNGPQLVGVNALLSERHSGRRRQQVRKFDPDESPLTQPEGKRLRKRSEEPGGSEAAKRVGGGGDETVPSEQRCVIRGGTGWRCPLEAAEGMRHCEKHLTKMRERVRPGAKPKTASSTLERASDAEAASGEDGAKGPTKRRQHLILEGAGLGGGGSGSQPEGPPNEVEQDEGGSRPKRQPKAKKEWEEDEYAVRAHGGVRSVRPRKRPVGGKSLGDEKAKVEELTVSLGGTEVGGENYGDETVKVKEPLDATTEAQLGAAKGAELEGAEMKGETAVGLEEEGDVSMELLSEELFVCVTPDAEPNEGFGRQELRGAVAGADASLDAGIGNGEGFASMESARSDRAGVAGTVSDAPADVGKFEEGKREGGEFVQLRSDSDGGSGSLAEGSLAAGSADGGSAGSEKSLPQQKAASLGKRVENDGTKKEKKPRPRKKANAQESKGKEAIGGMSFGGPFSAGSSLPEETAQTSAKKGVKGGTGKTAGASRARHLAAGDLPSLSKGMKLPSVTLESDSDQEPIGLKRAGSGSRAKAPTKASKVIRPVILELGGAVQGPVSNGAGCEEPSIPVEEELGVGEETETGDGGKKRRKRSADESDPERSRERRAARKRRKSEQMSEVLTLMASLITHPEFNPAGLEGFPRIPVDMETDESLSEDEPAAVQEDGQTDVKPAGVAEPTLFSWGSGKFRLPSDDDERNGKGGAGKREPKGGTKAGCVKRLKREPSSGSDPALTPAETKPCDAPDSARPVSKNKRDKLQETLAKFSMPERISISDAKNNGQPALPIFAGLTGRNAGLKLNPHGRGIRVSPLLMPRLVTERSSPSGPLSGPLTAELRNSRFDGAPQTDPPTETTCVNPPAAKLETHMSLGLEHPLEAAATAHPPPRDRAATPDFRPVIGVPVSGAPIANCSSAGGHVGTVLRANGGVSLPSRAPPPQVCTSNGWESNPPAWEYPQLGSGVYDFANQLLSLDAPMPPAMKLPKRLELVQKHRKPTAPKSQKNAHARGSKPRGSGLVTETEVKDTVLRLAATVKPGVSPGTPVSTLDLAAGAQRKISARGGNFPAEATPENRENAKAFLGLQPGYGAGLAPQKELSLGAQDRALYEQVMGTQRIAMNGEGGPTVVGEMGSVRGASGPYDYSFGGSGKACLQGGGVAGPGRGGGGMNPEHLTGVSNYMPSDPAPTSYTPSDPGFDLLTDEALRSWEQSLGRPAPPNPNVNPVSERLTKTGLAGCLGTAEAVFPGRKQDGVSLPHETTTAKPVSIHPAGLPNGTRPEAPVNNGTFKLFGTELSSGARAGPTAPGVARPIRTPGEHWRGPAPATGLVFGSDARFQRGPERPYVVSAPEATGVSPAFLGGPPQPSQVSVTNGFNGCPVYWNVPPRAKLVPQVIGPRGFLEHGAKVPPQRSLNWWEQEQAALMGVTPV